MHLLGDVRLGLRTLRKSRGFTIMAATILAVGIGVNAAVFTLINTIFFGGFPSVDPNNRLVYIAAHNNRLGWDRVSYPDFEDWRAQAKSFDGLAFVQRGGIRVLIRDRNDSAETYDLTRISANTFQVLRQGPILGRDFALFDEKPGAAPVAILNYGFWERRFGKDPAIVGQTVRIDRVPTTVIGVMPLGFDFPIRTDLWMPTEQEPNLQRRDYSSFYFVFGRMADGVTMAAAQAEMATIGRRLESAYPQTNQGYVPGVMDFPRFFFGPNASLIYASMFGAVGFVLLIACANLTNLMLARAVGRSREISVRIALGAGRWRIIRQMLIESVMLSGLGGVLGWWIAKWSIRIYELTAVPPEFYNHWRYPLDDRVLAYCVVISIGTGVVFGLAPAIQLSNVDLNAALKDGARGAAGGRRGRFLSNVLVASEMALAVVLLAGAGAMIHSFLNLYNTAIGVDTGSVLASDLAIPKDKYLREEAQISFYDRLTANLEAVPGVESVAIADTMPANGSRNVRYQLAGTALDDDLDRRIILQVVIGPTYFRTLRGTLLSGREFNDGDDVSGVPVAIVNQRFANESWPGADPIGNRLRLFDGKTTGPWLTVVGVAGNIIQDFSRRKIDPVVYLPYRQAPRTGMYVFVRTRVPPDNLAAPFRREVQALDPDAKVWHGPFVLAERLEHNYWDSRVNGTLFLIFAAIALLLAWLGLYAVIAYSVSQRTQEFGIRIAVGATARDILGLVFMQGTLPLVIGLTIGLAASFGVNRALQAQLVNVPPSDPITLAIASATLICAAILGCWIPARRAARVDPIVALRHE